MTRAELYYHPEYNMLMIFTEPNSLEFDGAGVGVLFGWKFIGDFS